MNLIGIAIFLGALLMLCFELANMYMQLITQKEVMKIQPKQEKTAPARGRVLKPVIPADWERILKETKLEKGGKRK